MDLYVKKLETLFNLKHVQALRPLRISCSHLSTCQTLLQVMMLVSSY